MEGVNLSFTGLQLHLGPEIGCSYNCRLVKLCSWGLLNFASFWMTCAGSWNTCWPQAPQEDCPFQRQVQQQPMGLDLPEAGHISGLQAFPERNVFQNYFHLTVKWKFDSQLCVRAALALSKETSVLFPSLVFVAFGSLHVLGKGINWGKALEPQNSSDPFPTPPWEHWLCCSRSSSG